MLKKIEKEFSWTATIAMLLAVLTVVVVYKYLFQTNWVPSGSMLPTLSVGEVMLSQNIHSPDDVERGDIVTFAHEPGVYYIKRLIGMPGDTIEIKDGVLYLNGLAQDEEYLMDDAPMEDYPLLVVPEGHYFMMGDNRNNSNDSRMFGSVAFEQMITKALFHYPSLLRRILTKTD